MAAETDRRTARARDWLDRTNPPNTEEKAYRLLGLLWTSAPAADPDIRATVRSILSGQRADGGWAHSPVLKPKAYSTGQALVALRVAGGVPSSDMAFQRGLDFLLETQEDDGSWFVKSRATPFPGFVNTGFPYGKSQLISISGSSWATAALILALPPASTASR
jgi:N-acyl-D-amino-acid deacylase